MPPGIALMVFNCAVNQGASTAIKVLQRALGVKVDGVIGSETIGALKKLNAITLIDEFAARQLIQYFNNEQFDEFGLGWTRRSIRAHRTSVLLSASKGTTA
jgi:lysozyme family protein